MLRCKSKDADTARLHAGRRCYPAIEATTPIADVPRIADPNGKRTLTILEKETVSSVYFRRIDRLYGSEH